MAGVEFAVDQRVKQDLGFVAGHFGCSSSAIHAERSMARARARRDITVPTGTPTVSAISRYDRLLISRRMKVSLKGSTSASTSRRIVARVALAQDLGLRRLLLFAPERRLLRGLRQVVDGGDRRGRAARIFGMADIAQDREQPRLHRRAAIAVEMLQRAQVTFLHRVLGVGRVAEQVARQRVHVVQIGQRRFAKASRPVGIVVGGIGWHRRSLGCRRSRCPAGGRPAAGQYCDALVSTATQP